MTEANETKRTHMKLDRVHRQILVAIDHADEPPTAVDILEHTDIIGYSSVMERLRFLHRHGIVERHREVDNARYKFTLPDDGDENDD